VRIFTCTLTVNAPLDAVYDYLADFETTTEWDPRIRHTERRFGDGGPGSVYGCSVFHLGRPTAMTYIVLDGRRPSEVQWVGRSRYLTQRDVLRLRRHPNGTTVVDWQSTFAYPALSGTSEGLLTLPLRQLCDRRQQGLQVALDGLGRSTRVPHSTPA
jgi:Polyketide cyclase / dehydrase and lipid transport